jgi:hypothetical protein
MAAQQARRIHQFHGRGQVLVAGERTLASIVDLEGDIELLIRADLARGAEFELCRISVALVRGAGGQQRHGQYADART